MNAPDSEAMPRWVKIFGIIALLGVIVFVVLHLTGIAPHGH